MAWSSPVPVGTRIGSNFGPRGSSIHLGDDYPPPKPGQQGVPVYAIGDGVVVGVGANLLKGHSGDRNVLIKHPGNIYSYYGHLNSNSVRLNQSVKGGQQIGVMGYRGNVQPPGPGGTHLHLGIIVNGSFVDPSVWLSGKGITVGKTPPVKASNPGSRYPHRKLDANPTWDELFAALDLVVRGANQGGGYATRAERIQHWLLRAGFLKTPTGKRGVIDGDWGRESWKALQRRLSDKTLRKPYTGPIDGLAPRSGKTGTTWNSAAAFCNDKIGVARKA